MKWQMKTTSYLMNHSDPLISWRYRDNHTLSRRRVKVSSVTIRIQIPGIPVVILPVIRLCKRWPEVTKWRVLRISNSGIIPISKVTYHIRDPGHHMEGTNGYSPMEASPKTPQTPTTISKSSWQTQQTSICYSKWKRNQAAHYNLERIKMNRVWT